MNGCTSSPRVAVDQAADVDFARCRTFAWHAPDDAAASFTDQRVREQVMQTLAAKGYAEKAEQPDCRITYALTAREQPRSKPGVGVGVGGGSHGIGGGIGITLPVGKRGAEGRFTLDVIDAARNAQIWSGSIEDTFKAPDLSADDVQRVVEAVLAEYPDAAR